MLMMISIKTLLFGIWFSEDVDMDNNDDSF
mgnify:CR=1 FL=1